MFQHQDIQQEDVQRTPKYFLHRLIMGEDFRLKWNDHHNVFFSTAEQLCHGDHLTDVTLSCGDKEFSAHKLVLSICSSYFSQLFAPRPQSSTRRRPADSAAIVYLKDVDPRHMELLMNYMYRGEINVEETELMGLLATAKGLQIKGLTENDEEDSKPQQTYSDHSSPAVASTSSRNSVTKKRPAPRPSSSGAASAGPSTPSGSSHSAPKKIKEEIKPFIEATPTVVETYPDTEPTNEEEDYLEAEDPSEMGVESHQYDLDTEQGESMAYEGDPNNPGVELEPVEIPSLVSGKHVFQCPICVKVMEGFVKAVIKSNMKRHILAHTGFRPYICQLCQATYTRKETLLRHMTKTHQSNAKHTRYK